LLLCSAGESDIVYRIGGGIPWQVYFQRVLSTKKVKYAQALSYTASFGALFMAIPAILVGAIAKSTDWSTVDMPRSLLHASDNTTLADTRLVVPVVLQYLTPQWVSIFGMGAISAAVMSSADSSILSAASMFSHNIYKVLFRPKASQRELLWVLRGSILAVGAAATSMALTIKSIYYLFALCSDLVFVLLLPQLVCALYVPFANGYGSFFGYTFGLFMRLAGGEYLIRLPPLIEYPMYQEDELRQLFPFRTLSMLCSLFTLIAVSYLTKIIFTRNFLSPKFDILGVFHEKKKINDEVTVSMMELTTKL